MSLSHALQPEKSSTRRWSIFDAVRIILGALLLAAAGLKGYQLATEPTIESSLLTSHWFLMAVVEWELLLGVWLLVGVFPNVLRWTALVWFVVLLGTSLSQAAGGARSCACFGFVEVAPWVVVVADAIAVVALWLFRPAVKPKSVRIPFANVVVVVAVKLYFGVAISGAAAMWQGRSKRPLLTASSPVIDLGTVPQGEATIGTVWLTNVDKAPVAVDTIETSCPCLEIKLSKSRVRFQERVKLVIRFDSSVDRRFTGDLQLRAGGTTIDRRIAFVVLVKTNVMPHDVVNHRVRSRFKLWFR